MSQYFRDRWQGVGAIAAAAPAPRSAPAPVIDPHPDPLLKRSRRTIQIGHTTTVLPDVRVRRQTLVRPPVMLSGLRRGRPPLGAIMLTDDGSGTHTGPVPPAPMPGSGQSGTPGSGGGSGFTTTTIKPTFTAIIAKLISPLVPSGGVIVGPTFPQPQPLPPAPGTLLPPCSLFIDVPNPPPCSSTPGVTPPPPRPMPQPLPLPPPYPGDGGTTTGYGPGETDNATVIPADQLLTPPVGYHQQMPSDVRGWVPILLIGGGLVAAYFLFRKKGGPVQNPARRRRRRRARR